jgi:tetratricopeptide (TPR) repeat protein
MELFRRLLRWLFAIGSVGLSIYLIRRGIAAGGLTASFSPILAAMILLVIGAILIAPELVAIVTKPLFALADSIFFPGGKLSKPVLSYTLPEFYTKEGRFDEALDEYRKILRYYPREGQAYLGAIELLVTEFDDKGAAKELYRRARQKLRDQPEDWLVVETRWQWLANKYLIQ